MRDAILPDALLASAMGLSLSYAAPVVARQSAALMVAASIGIGLIPIAGLPEDIAFTGCWVSVVVTAASVHLKNGPNRLIASLLAMNAGIWAGLVTHVSHGVTALIFALPFVLLFIAGQWVVKRGWGIALKVASSWLIAIACLETALTLVPTPGYKADHMD